MDISIIIPVFKVKEYIEECILSVMCQRNIENLAVECILINDQTPDDSFKIANELINKYDGPIKFIAIERDENGGLSEARNTGIHQSTGKYLYFLDSDDFLDENCISILWSCLKKCPNANIVYGQSESYPNPILYQKYFDIKSLMQQDVLYDRTELYKYHLLIPEVAWNKLISAEWLKKNELYFVKKLINEDYAWHIKSYFHIKSCAYCGDSKATYFYRQRGQSIIAEQPELERQFNKFEILVKTAISAPFWDKNFFHYLLEAILNVRFNFPDLFYKQIASRFKFQCDLLLTSANVTGWKYLLLRYSFMPKSIMKVKILKYFSNAVL